MKVGVISDTHGYLDPRAVQALEGVDCILHAGDIGGPEVLEGLRRIAPVIAVRGNNDTTGPSSELSEHAKIELGGVRIQLVHEIAKALDWHERVLVFGHSHKAVVLEDSGRLFVNPGAAGRRGFHREISVALLTLGDSEPAAEIVPLGARAGRSV